MGKFIFPLLIVPVCFGDGVVDCDFRFVNVNNNFSRPQPQVVCLTAGPVLRLDKSPGVNLG